MSDNNIKTNAKTSADVSAESLKQSVTEYLEKAAGDKSPKNIGGAEKVLELYQKVIASGLPDEDKENLTLNLLSEWGKIVGDISETALNAQPELSVGYILSQIENIRKDNEHVLKALSDLENLVINDGVGDIANQSRCDAIGNAVKCRETTNQKLIAFYEKLYDDLKPSHADFSRLPLIELITAIERCDAEVTNPETSKALKSLLIDKVRAACTDDSYKLKFEALADFVSAYNEPSISDLRSLAQSLRKG